MTVTSSTSRDNYVGNGSNDTFPITFDFLDSSHVSVYHTPVATGVTLLLTEGVEYNVVGTDVVFVTPPLLNDLITNLRNVPVDQQRDYIDYETFPADSHEEALDKLTMIAQQHQEELDRTVKGPIAETENVDYTFPLYSAGKGIKWSDSDPKILENSTYDADTQADSAAASAAAASISEVNAAASESNALSSELAAASYLAGLTGLGVRNHIDNGCFRIWQRTTSQIVAGVASADRWLSNFIGGGNTFSRQDFTVGQTEVLGNPTHYGRCVFTAGTLVGDYSLLSQHVMDVRKFSGRTVTLSFWAKAATAMNIATELVQSFGTIGGSAPVSSIGVTTHALTTSWQQFICTFTIPSIIGKTIGYGSSGLDDNTAVNFWLSAGSNYDARTNSLGLQAGTLDIANVQLEYESVATEFEPRPLSVELQRCQRHFCKSYDQLFVVGQLITSGQLEFDSCTGGAGGSTIRGYWPFPVTMHFAPSVSLYSPVTGTIDMIRLSSGSDGAVNSINRISDAGYSEIILAAALATGIYYSWHYAAYTGF